MIAGVEKNVWEPPPALIPNMTSHPASLKAKHCVCVYLIVTVFSIDSEIEEVYQLVGTLCVGDFTLSPVSSCV